VGGGLTGGSAGMTGSAGSFGTPGGSGGMAQGGGAGTTATGGSAGSVASAGAGGMPGGGTPDVKVVAYLQGSSDPSWANKINFSKMTHLNLAFATANGQNNWDMHASDDVIKALVAKAHAAGVKVLASLGGGGGDTSVVNQYSNPSNDDQLVSNLDSFLNRLNLDGADIDIEKESEGEVGTNYSTFVAKVVAKLHPEGKLVTAAVAEYLQGYMHDDALKSFDFVNIMIYTNNMSDYTSIADYYVTTKGMAKTKVTLGVPFFGTDSGGGEYGYAQIMGSDGNAWSKNQAQVNGQTVSYAGIDTMKQLATLSKNYGGVMFWDLSLDVSGDHSLWKTIQDTM
jgi:GH18 family chitinase